MSGDTLKRVAYMVDLMVAQAAAVAEAERVLAAAQAEFRRTEQEELPELMREIGITELKLENGTEVTVSEEVAAAITEANRAQAHEWLRAHDFGGLIKTVVAVEFGRGEEEEARELAQEVADEWERPANVEERVHPSTLKSFVKEQLAAGAPIPFDIFSIRPFNKAKVKPPRARK